VWLSIQSGVILKTKEREKKRLVETCFEVERVLSDAQIILIFYGK
jgi:hypothetical protein